MKYFECVCKLGDLPKKNNKLGAYQVRMTFVYKIKT